VRANALPEPLIQVRLAGKPASLPILLPSGEGVLPPYFNKVSRQNISPAQKL
jgi:hypothetical protein